MLGIFADSHYWASQKRWNWNYCRVFQSARKFQFWTGGRETPAKFDKNIFKFMVDPRNPREMFFRKNNCVTDPRNVSLKKNIRGEFAGVSWACDTIIFSKKLFAGVSRVCDTIIFSKKYFAGVSRVCDTIIFSKNYFARVSRPPVKNWNFIAL